VELSPRPACVLFDCDGTLVDSELLGNVALAEELALAGIAESGEALTARFRGHKLADMLEALQATHRMRLPPGFVDAYRRRAADMFEKGVVPIPGVVAMLERLAGLPLATCIVSNGPLAKIRQNLRVAGLGRHFGERLFSAYEVGSWKPEPGLFLHAALVMGAAPGDCVVVDDSATGVEAARRAGMRALWFTPHGTPAGVPSHATAFSDMAALADLVGR
jgi:HAD superfamily hydrolase (TIGR01509 family)